MANAKKMTLEEFAVEFEGRNHNLIYGIPEAMPPAKARNGKAQFAFAKCLGPLFERKSRGPGAPPGGWWFVTEAPVRYGHLHLFSHDIAGWKSERAPKSPDDYPIALTPDWVCEVLSSNIRNDTHRKQKILHQWNVPFYWSVDPEDQEIRVLESEESDYRVVIEAGLGFVGPMPPFDAVPLSVN
jgi:Uma2 family endonuclease